jgi:hypothetical protein
MEEGTNIPYPSSSSRSQNEIARRAGQENNNKWKKKQNKKWKIK